MNLVDNIRSIKIDLIQGNSNPIITKFIDDIKNSDVKTITNDRYYGNSQSCYFTKNNYLLEEKFGVIFINRDIFDDFQKTLNLTHEATSKLFVYIWTITTNKEVLEAFRNAYAYDYLIKNY